MLYQRLELHLDEETRRQLEAQAAQNNQAVDEFCVEIIRQYLSSAAPTRAHNGGAVDHQGTDHQDTGLVELDPVVAQR